MTVEISTEPCPECHEICGWCSWFRHQAREIGCGLKVPSGVGRRSKKRCEKAEALRGTKCGTCDGSRKVTVRREIIAPPTRELREAG